MDGPDYLDVDADGDGIDDVDEAGANPGSPVDSNGDGLADFQDPNSHTTITGTVYLDDDRNGSLDAGETDLSGVSVELINSAGTVVQTAVTASPYTFTQVPAGNYTVSVDTSTLASGLLVLDDVDGGSDNEVAVSVDGVPLVNIDFGEAYGIVSGTITDEDGNTMGGVNVTLTDVAGTSIIVTTNDDGTYSFGGTQGSFLVPGEITATALVNGGMATASTPLDGALGAELNVVGEPLIIPVLALTG